tara:strand:- start:185 stop:442 length:258 start_codon:yes stop_codon:yes gene_type:complete
MYGKSLKTILLISFLFFSCSKDLGEFQLNKGTYKMWKKFIKPTKDELSWTQIPWLTTFYDGLIESDRQQKPVLLWVMNGHPLGCT